MLIVVDQFYNLLKLRKISLPFRREKSKSLEEGNDVFLERIDVIDLIVPHTVRSVS